MFAFVPALGTALQGFVVIFLRFLGEPFQAEVAAHFVAVLVKRQQGEEPGRAPVAVAERNVVADQSPLHVRLLSRL